MSLLPIGWRPALGFALAFLAGGAVAYAAGSDLTGSTGKALYAQNCASCHGVNLEGQPDWMRRKPDGRLPAPPHDRTGHTWHHSDRQLFIITKAGLQALAPGYESDMPAFEHTLSDEQIIQILHYIVSTWPEREQAYQRARTEADPISGPIAKPVP
jgi:mono/diheme cytochrome c family protein